MHVFVESPHASLLPEGEATLDLKMSFLFSRQGVRIEKDADRLRICL